MKEGPLSGGAYRVALDGRISHHNTRGGVVPSLRPETWPSALRRYGSGDGIPVGTGT